MSRIHPAAAGYNRCAADHSTAGQYRTSSSSSSNTCDHQMLTVWKRSSMTFQGTDGFTVFDSHGILAFRVDNYTRNKLCDARGIVLMDGAGKPLLSLKPQPLSMQYQWNGYRGDDQCGKSPRTRVFAMRRSRLALFHGSEYEGEVFMAGPVKKESSRTPDFTIEGSFIRRNCKIKSTNGQVVAKIARKRGNTTVLLSDDVFSLVVHPGFEPELIMAFVIILDRMCRMPFSPVLCS